MGLLDSLFGTGSEKSGGDRSYKPPVYGTTADGKPVTASFGREGSSREGHTLLSDGHRSAGSFYGSQGNEGHDHYDGRGGGTQRGQYTGKGS